MKDFTEGPIVRHILSTALPICIGLLTEIAYQLVSLHFVTRLGATATAGVNAAGNVMLAIDSLVFVLVIGTVSLVAHAIGRKDTAQANLVFNQALLLSLICSLATAGLSYLLAQPYLKIVAADSATVSAGTEFLAWALPGFALLLPMGIFSCALRAIGIVRASVAAYTLTLIVNIILAPLAVAGWYTGVSLGVMGAGIATSISIGTGTVFLMVRFHQVQRQLSITPTLLLPRLACWRQILLIGTPAGIEFLLSFLSVALVFYAIGGLGASVQAGFGIGSRIQQALLLPGMAIALSAAPIVGQNFGARNFERVKETFFKTTAVVTTLMIAAALLLQWQATAICGMFDTDPVSAAVAARYLQITSWTAVLQGLVYMCSTAFQGLGNTLPSLISVAVRFSLFSISSIWLSKQPGFYVEQVWYVMIVSIAAQALVSLSLLRTEFKSRLLPAPCDSSANGAVPGLPNRLTRGMSR